jgi:autotransporter family porin
MNTARGMVIAAIGLACAACAAAASVHVNGDCGDDTWTGATSDCVAPDGPKATIQAGIDAAVDGDEVVVAVGTYTGVGNRDISFMGKMITVRSADPTDPSTVETTIIDCEQVGRGFVFTCNETSASMLIGVTIVNGKAPDGSAGEAGQNGGGILCEYSAPTIDRCVLYHCSAGDGGIGTPNDGGAGGNGGGIYSHGGSPLVTQCVVRDCSAGDGGSADDNGGDGGYGGGMHYSNASSTITECEVTGCRAGVGGTATGYYDHAGRGGGGGGLGADGVADIVVSQCHLAAR